VFLSGFAALTYETLWVRLLGNLFGHTIYAVQTVLCVFFAGIALGAWLFSVIARRTRITLRTFAVLEMLIAGFGALLPATVSWITPVYDIVAPLHTESTPAELARFAITALVLLPPAMMMGATFPALVCAGSFVRGPSVAAIYFVNTLGGAAGAWVSVFVLTPWLGVRASSWFAVACNVCAALLAATLASSRTSIAGEGVPPGEPKPSWSPPASIHPRAVLETKLATLFLFVTGLTSIALQVVWTRALEQVLSGTIYTFATILTAFLIGIAGGSAWTTAAGHLRSERTVGWLLLLLAVLVMLSSWIIPLLDLLDGFLRRSLPATTLHSTLIESLLSLALLLPATTLFGLLFPILLELGKDPSRPASVGWLTAVNTLGCVLGPLLAAFVLLPMGSTTGALWVLAGILTGTALIRRVVSTYAARSFAGLPGAGGPAAASTLGKEIGSPARPSLPGILGGTIAVGLSVLVSWVSASLSTEDETLIAQIEDAAATVAVVKRGEDRYLRVNRTFSLGGGRGVFTERRQGHLSMFLHPRPRSVLVLGVGTANTLGAVSLHEPPRLVAADLLGGVIRMAREHFGATNYGVLANGSAEVLTADASRIVRSSRERFDVIVGDLFHPWQAGVATLYTREHFESVRGCLEKGGVFAQWLPLYQLSTEDFKLIARTFLQSFPFVQAWLGNFGVATPIVALSGSEAPIELDHERVKASLVHPVLGSALETVYFHLPVETYASFVCDRDLLESYVGSGELHTKDRPVLEFSAAATLFREELEFEKRRTLQDLVKLAAEQDRKDRGRGLHDEIWYSNRLAVRAMIVSLIAAEMEDFRQAGEAALIAVERSVDYDVPVRVLLEIAAFALEADATIAESLYRKATEVTPRESRGWLGLGRALRRLERSEEAADALSRALELYPGCADARLELNALSAKTAPVTN